jgi:hypothetical protein
MDTSLFDARRSVHEDSIAAQAASPNLTRLLLTVHKKNCLADRVGFGGKKAANETDEKRGEIREIISTELVQEVMLE